MKLFQALVIAAVAVTSTVKVVSATYTLLGKYDSNDDSCSKAPTIMVVMNDPTGKCQATSCSAHGKTSCTTDPVNALAAAFGSKPYLMSGGYADPTCSVLTSGTVTVIDGTCHVFDDQNSVKATVNDDKTVSVTLYIDTKCMTASSDGTFVLSSDIVNKCSDHGMWSVANIVLGKSKATTTPVPTAKPTPPAPAPTAKPTPLATPSVANTPLPVTTTSAKPVYAIKTMFADDKCTTTTVVTIARATNSNCRATPCSSRQSVRCTNDVKSAVSSAFGATPYLMNAAYTDATCSTVDTAVVSRIDGLCRVLDDGTIFKVVTNGDKTVTGLVYSDTKCAKVAGQMVFSADNVGVCTDQCARRGTCLYTVGNIVLGHSKVPPTPAPAPVVIANPNTKAVAMGFYPSATCNDIPRAFVLSRYATTKSPAGVDVCTDYNCNTGTAITCVDDLSKFVRAAFRNTPFVATVAFKDTKCTSVIGGLVVPIDGSCINLHGMYARAQQNKDKSVSVKYYADSTCKMAASNAPPALTVTSSNAGICSDSKIASVVNASLK